MRNIPPNEPPPVQWLPAIVHHLHRDPRFLECSCDNKDHLKQGAKLALVTDGDNKIWTVENPDKLSDHMGHYVQVKGVANAEAATIKVETASALPEPKQ